MTQITGTLTNAADRQVNRRDGQGSFTLHEIWIDGRGPFVARRDVYTLALGLLNQRVVAQVRSEQKGDFTNHFLDHVAADWNGAQVPQQPNYPQAMPQPQQTAPPPQSQVYTPPPEDPRAIEERKNLSIHRQTAAKVAAQISGDNPMTFWSNVNDLVRYFQTGQAPVLTGGYTPEPLNQGDPGPDPTRPGYDDNIPF